MKKNNIVVYHNDWELAWRYKIIWSNGKKLHIYESFINKYSAVKSARKLFYEITGTMARSNGESFVGNKWQLIVEAT